MAYATKSGGTAEIAQIIADELQRSGLRAEVHPVDEVPDLRKYDAVVLGSAVYFGKWRPEALRFGESNADLLRERSVWLFDSGPLFTWPDEGRNEPVKEADELKASIGARSRTTFGGRLRKEDTGFIMRRVMASGKAGSYGDFRNPVRIRAWARDIAQELLASPITLAA